MTRLLQFPRPSRQKLRLSLLGRIIACALSGPGCASLLLSTSVFRFAPSSPPSPFHGTAADLRLISELAQEGNLPWLLLCVLDLPLSFSVDTITAPLILVFFHGRSSSGDPGEGERPGAEPSEPTQPEAKDRPYGYEALFPVGDE